MFLAAAPRFQRLPVSQIFELPDAGDGRLSASPILPIESYKLLKKSAAPLQRRHRTRRFQYQCSESLRQTRHLSEKAHCTIQLALTQQCTHTHHVTYSTDGSLHATCIDLAIVKQPDLVKDFKVSPAPFAARHHFIHFNYCMRLPTSETSSRYTRSISKISPSTFPTAVASSLNNKIDMESLPHIDLISTDTDNCAVIDRLVAEVTDGILEALDVAAPLRLTTLRAKVKPWVTQELRKLMRSRDDAYRSYLRSLSASALARYKQLRRSVKNLLDTAKNTYISNKLASASSPADYWRTMRGIGIASHSTSLPLKFFTPDQLCRYYASVSSASPAINADAVTASLASASDQLGAATFGFQHVTPLDVELALKKCRSSSCGSDGISASVLRLASPALYGHLAEVFNLSFDLGVFPTVWKSASVVALAKVPSPASPSDTRPISLLPEMSKVLERLAHAQLIDYLNRQNLLDTSQHGFKAAHSTQTALLELTDAVRSAIEKKKVTLLVSFDFSKAFDTIDHSLLIEKLRSVGCNTLSLRWFISYLSDRRIAVRHENGSLTASCSTTSGIPQGSVLGPLLFAVFVNDLHTVLQHSNHIVYADDTQISLHTTTLIAYCNSLQTVRKTLATALVLPHLDYAPAVYDSVTQEQNLRLQRVQNACVRFVYGSIPRTAHVTPYRLALGWLSVRRRREMRIALLALEILRGGSPSQLRTPFKLLADHPEIRTSPRRIRPLVYYNAKRTGALTKSFTHTASRILSALPFEITLANPASTYKKLIFNHLFSLDKNYWKTRCTTENLTLIPPSLTNILTFT
ncbi:unnamed protein product [Trichogramma brassicae]|uniref:Reverse transcriptase domain-containing protein n=1 Tax=Trichogramma brassicae TaxID=86971 RepID=A0A6H5IHV9_9HYME|nr:unnamed protein product [Trichogramma brassicae]